MRRRKVYFGLVFAYIVALVAAALVSPTVVRAQVPTVTLSVPSEVFIGEDFTFTATFDNTDPVDAGYGPYIDLIFPFNGADGVGGVGTDGIDFVSADYLGAALNTTVLSFPDDGSGSGCVQHPYAVDATNTPIDVCGTAGDKLVVVELPFGSFTNDQPPAPVTIGASLSDLADLGTALTIQARGGFRYGADALNNPATDPSIVGSWTSASVTPILIRLVKEYSGPEDETATGPNYPRQYTITVDIANGQLITNLDVIDELPNNMAFLSLDATSPAGATTIDLPTVGAAANSPDNDLIVRFASVIGGTGSNDASVTFSYFIPEFDADGVRILNTGAGEDDVISENQARAVGDWTPVDSRDVGGIDNAVADPVGVEHTLNDRPIAIQKGVSIVNDVAPTGPSPGDTLEYTLEFQISDYFTFGNIVVTDVMGDGQDFDSTFTPTLNASDRGGTFSGTFTLGTNYTLDTSQQTTCGNGSSTLTFDVSALLQALGDDGIMQGGRAISPDAGAATGTITFRSVILENYYCVAGDASVDHGDHINNDVTISATERDNTNISTTIGNETEVSSAGVTIVRGTLTKDIYARNGNTADTGPQFAPGDTITYRITYTLPTSDTENLYFDDYLPLPVLYATEVTTFNASICGVPSAGTACYGPNDTFHTLSGAPTPTLSSDATANRLRFFYGTYDGNNNTSSVIDLLFTVTVSDDPFADGLYLTNQVRVYENNTFGETTVEDKIVQFELTEPVLNITKGLVGTDNSAGVFSPAQVGPSGVNFGTPTGGAASCPTFSGTINSNGLAANPVDSDLSNVDASDWVRYAIVVENTGSGLYGAFDVRVEDDLPVGIDPASVTNFCVTDGAGNALSYTGTLNDFLNGSGIELTDPSTSQGALAAYDATSGANILVITYDAQLQASVGPGDVLTSSATVTNYAGRDTTNPADPAPNHVPNGISDAATITVTGQQLEKSIVSTNKAYTTDTPPTTYPVAIGEQVQYRVVATVPEGTVAPMQIVDTLDAGLAFVQCDSIATSAGLSTTLAGGFAAACDNVNGPTVTNNGQTITFDLGTVTNSDTNNGTAETITIEYTVVVLNVNSNTRTPTTQLNNSATWGSATASAPNVTVVEPTLTVNVAASPSSGDAGDTITLTIDVAHDAASNMDAQDVVLTDVIPSGMTYVPGTLSATGTATPTTLNEVGGTITATWDSLPLGQSAQITFDVTLDANVHPRDVITDTADLTWQSLDDDPGQISTHNANSYERTGSGATNVGELNNYSASASASVTVPDPTLAKAITATNKAYTSGTEVAIGEIVTYTVTVTVPEGQMSNVQVADQLDVGLAFVGCTGIAASLDLSTDLVGGFAAACSDPANPTVASSGRTITFDLGNITNVSRDNANDETITIIYDVVVLNVSGNQRTPTTQLNNSATLAWTDAGGTNNYSVGPQTTSVTVVEPEMAVAVTPSAPNGDAGDTITYTVTVTNPTGTNDMDAQDVHLENLIPAGMTYVSGTWANTGGLAPTAISDAAAPTLTADWDSFPLGQTSTFTFQARIDYTNTPGQVLADTATLTWQSLDNNPISQTSYNTTDDSTERTGADGLLGSGALNDYQVQAVAPVTVNNVQPTKAIVSTSESISGALANGNEQVVIGEIVRYRAEVQIPEGSSPSFQIEDLLPNGLQFINDGTAMVAFVASTSGAGAGIESSTLGTGPQQVGDETTLAGITPSYVLPGTAISGGGSSGADVIFSLGDLTNNDSDANQEFVVLEFNALVVNEAGNQAGDVLPNSYNVRIGGSVVATSNVVNVEIGEPSAALTMAITTTPTDAGDAVQYTITVTNNSGTTVTPAMDVRVVDTLDANLTLGTVTTTVPAGRSATDNSTGNTVDVTIDRLDPGESATIVVDATVNAGAAAALTVDNTADLTYTSLPGTGTVGNPTGSTTPGGSGAANGERNGADGVGGALNDYAGQANASFTLATPLIEKIQPVPATYPIGATVTYDIRVTLPEGVTRALDVLDILPPGVAYDGNLQIITSAAASGGLLTNDFAGTVNTAPTVTTAGGSGDDVTFTFGDTTTTANNNPNDNAFIIRFEGRILNEVGNQDGITLISDGALHYTNPNTNATETVNANQVQVTVIEPQLNVTVTADNQMPGFGDTVTYTITVQHDAASTADAHDVHLTELVPSGMTYVPGSLQYVSGPTATLDDSGAPTLVADWGSIPQGQTAVIQYQATVDGSPPNNIGDVLTDDVNATWTSISGANPNERNGADGVGGALNDYATTANVPVGISLVSATKTDALQVDVNGNGQVNPGDTIRYTVVVRNSGAVADAQNVVFTDTPDANTTLVVGSVTTTAGTVTSGNNAGDTSVAVDLGTLAQNASVTITFDVTVNQPFPSGVVQVQNQGRVSGSNFSAVDTDDPDTTATLGDPTITPIVAAPLVEADKVDALHIDANGDGVYNSGDTIRYTVTIINSGDQNASDVVFTDTPDANTTLVVGSVTTTTGTVTSGNNAGDTSVAVDIGTMLGDDGAGNYDTVTITFDVTINASLVPPTTIQVANQGTVSGSNFPDEPTDDPDTGPEDDPTISPLISAPIIQARKTDALTNDLNGNGVADGGDTLTYTVTLVNVGGVDAQNVVFTDTPDTNTTLVVGSVTTTVGTVTTGNAAGDTSVAVNVGTLAANGGSVTITFQVVVVNPIPSGVTEVANQGTASGDNFTDTPTDDPDTTTADDPTRTPIGAGVPTVSATKTDALTNDVNGNGLVDGGDTLTYTVTLTNNGTADATNVVFTDTPDANTTLVVGSVTTTAGTVTTGNNAGDTTVAVNVGTLARNASVTITFQVVVVNPIPSGVTEVANQGTVSGSNFANVLTDDPDTGTPDDPTRTPLANAPNISATKTDALTNDVNGNGLADGGDTLTYTVTLTNNGGADATSVVFTDTPDANTTLVVGSVTTTAGTVTTGNAAGDTSVAVDVGTLAANGGSVTITFQVVVVNPIPSGVAEVANQGTTTCANCTTAVPTDDPDTPAPDDPTRTPVGDVPILQGTLRDTLSGDANGNGEVNPGDILTYTMVVTNATAVDALNALFTDTPDANTTLVVGSVTTSQGTVTSGNTAGDTTVGVDFGTLPANGSATVTFQVRVNDPLPTGTTQVATQGTLSCSNCPTDARTDDPDTAASLDPTATPIVIPPNAPQLRAIKRDALFTDADGDGVPSAGDTLRYTVVITNTGAQTATGATFTDTPDANTTLEVGSVTSTQGIITTGNNVGDTSVAVDIGDIPPNVSVTIIFRVLVNNPLPTGTYQVANQGTVTCPPCNGDTPTDDPDTPSVDDPTITPLGAVPRLELYKTVTLSGDANGDGNVNVGDVLTYTVEVHNYGNSAATNVHFTDTPDTNTTLIIGSTTASDPTATITEDSGGVTVDIPSIPPSGMVTITFQVRVRPDLAPTVTLVGNQGLASCPPCVLGDEPTDDPSTPTDDDPTVIAVVPPPPPPAPQITVFDPAISKVGELLPGQLGLPGEQLTWTFTITNNGNAAGTDVVITDTIQSELRIDGADIEVGTATVSGQLVTFNIPVLNPGQTVIAHVYTTVLRSPYEGLFENTAQLTGMDPNGAVQTATDTAVLQGVSGLPATGYPPQEPRGTRAWVWALLALGAATLLGATAWHTRRHARQQPRQ